MVILLIYKSYRKIDTSKLKGNSLHKPLKVDEGRLFNYTNKLTQEYALWENYKHYY